MDKQRQAQSALSCLLRRVQTSMANGKGEAKLLCNLRTTYRSGLNFKAGMLVCCSLYQSRQKPEQHNSEPRNFSSGRMSWGLHT